MEEKPVVPVEVIPEEVEEVQPEEVEEVEEVEVEEAPEENPGQKKNRGEAKGIKKQEESKGEENHKPEDQGPGVGPGATSWGERRRKKG